MKDAGAKLIVAGSEQESADYADRSIAAFAEAHERIGELLRTTYQTTGSPYGADSSVRRKFPSVRGSGHRPATLALLELINGSVG